MQQKKRISYPKRSAQVLDIIVDWAPLSTKAWKKEIQIASTSLKWESISAHLQEHNPQFFCYIKRN